MWKRLLLMMLVLGVVFGGIFGFQAFKNKMMGEYFATMKPPPVTVSATLAEAQTWSPLLTTIGTLKAIQGVQVSTETPGMISQIYFKAGQQVAAGDLLVQLDDSADRAQLGGLQAEQVLAAANYARQRKLVQQQVVSKGDFDTTEASLRNSEAQVANKQALIAKKAIRAPFAGTLGVRRVNLGEYLAPGAPVVELQALDPIWVEFSLPEQAFHRVKLGQSVKIQVDAVAEQSFTGNISAIDVRINESSRNFLIQATLANPDRLLLPGMFAQVAVAMPIQENVVTLPVTAVEFKLYGDSVFLIKETGKDSAGQPLLTVTRQYVVPGEQRGNLVAIKEGVKPGDWVVTSGQLKLQNDSQVLIDNSVKL